MAILVLPDNGQQMQIDDAIASNDETLRQLLAVVFPSAGNADIKREQTPEGETKITIVKRAGTKGQSSPAEPWQPTNQSVLDFLAQAPESINPALELAWEYKQKTQAGQFNSLDVLVAAQQRLQHTYLLGKIEKARLDLTLAILKEATPSPSRYIPYGF
jgi:hypothetical protein